MRLLKAYDEVIDFIAGGSSPESVSEFRASEKTQVRVAELVARAKDEALTEDERSELDLYVPLEHLMRLAKARARKHLSDRHAA